MVQALEEGQCSAEPPFNSINSWTLIKNWNDNAGDPEAYFYRDKNGYVNSEQEKCVEALVNAAINHINRDIDKINEIFGIQWVFIFGGILLVSVFLYIAGA